MSFTRETLRNFVFKKIVDIGSSNLTIDQIQVFNASEEELNSFLKEIGEYYASSDLLLTFEDASTIVYQKKFELSKWAYRLKDFFINKNLDICGRMATGCEYIFDAQEEKWTKLK